MVAPSIYMVGSMSTWPISMLWDCTNTWQFHVKFVPSNQPRMEGGGVRFTIVLVKFCKMEKHFFPRGQWPFWQYYNLEDLEISLFYNLFGQKTWSVLFEFDRRWRYSKQKTELRKLLQLYNKYNMNILFTENTVMTMEHDEPNLVLFTISF